MEALRSRDGALRPDDGTCWISAAEPRSEQVEIKSPGRECLRWSALDVAEADDCDPQRRRSVEARWKAGARRREYELRACGSIHNLLEPTSNAPSTALPAGMTKFKVFAAMSRLARV